MESPFAVYNSLDSKRVPSVANQVSDLGRWLKAKLDLILLSVSGYHKSNVIATFRKATPFLWTLLSSQPSPDSFNRGGKLPGPGANNHITKLGNSLLVC